MDLQEKPRFNSYNAELENQMLNMQSSDSSVDIMSWILKVLQYWYLYLIAIIIALGLAYIKNKSWTPTYRTATTVLVQEKGRGDWTSGYQLGQASSYVNQMITYKSRDFITKVVGRLDSNYDIYYKQRFKDQNLYKRAPVQIKSTHIANQAYGLEFRITGIDENSYSIEYLGVKQNFLDKLLGRNKNPIEPFSITGRYGESLQQAMFFLEIDKTDLFYNPKYVLYVKFFSDNTLINNYSSRLTTKLFAERSSVLEISLQGKVAQRDIDFLNLLNQEFFEQNLMSKNEAAEKSVAFIEDQLTIMRDSIGTTESRLSEFETTSGLYAQQSLSASKSQQLQGLTDQLQDIEYRKKYLDYLRTELNKDGILPDPTVLSVNNPMLTRSVTEHNVLYAEIKSIGEMNPLRAEKERRLLDLKAQIKSAMATMYDAVSIEERELSRRQSRMSSEVKNLPQKERQLLNYKRDYDLNESYYYFLLQKRTESHLQKASNSPDNIVIDKPRMTGVVNGSEKNGHYMTYLIIGLLIPLLYVISKEILFKFSVQTREEVERITGFPIISTIEHSARKEQMVVKKFPRSSFAEAFRSLRSRLEFIVQKESPIALLVTSTEPQDGKTFIAINTASIYQIAGKKVVVVDFDLRRPMLSKALGLDNRKGLSNYLINQISLEEAIIMHPDLDFDILPAGVTPPNPSELIRSDKTKNLIARLTKEYDYVILDCSPVGLVSDAHFLSRLVDTVLYIVRNEKTNRNFLRYTVKELREDNITNISIVYNDVNIKAGYYGSRRYYGKSSYYLKHGSYYHNEED